MKTYVNKKTGREIQTADPTIFESVNAQIGRVEWVEKTEDKGTSAKKASSEKPEDNKAKKVEESKKG